MTKGIFAIDPGAAGEPCREQVELSFVGGGGEQFIVEPVRLIERTNQRRDQVHRDGALRRDATAG